MVLANAKNGNRVQWWTQLIVHRKLSHNCNFFYLFSLYFRRFLPWFALALCNLEAAAVSLRHQSWCLGKFLTVCQNLLLRRPQQTLLHQRAALPGWWVGKHQAWDTGKYLAILLAQTLLLRGMKSSFVFTYTEWFVQLPLLLYITYTGSDRRQGRKRVVKSQKFSQPVRIWISGEHSI